MIQIDKIESLVGLEYNKFHLDCADFVALTQAQLFNREIIFPKNRKRGARGQMQIGGVSDQYGVPTLTPENGDLVLMYDQNLSQSHPSHVGTYFFLDYEPYVLHITSSLGYSWLHKVCNLPDYGVIVENYYKWKC